MMTRDGLLTVLESLIAQGIEIGLYVNELDGDHVSVGDVEEPRNYKRITVTEKSWTVDPESLQATCEKVTFNFSGRAGKVLGYFAMARGRIVTYEQFMDPIPVNTNEDTISVRPRILAEALVT